MSSTLRCVGTGSWSKACVTHGWFGSPAETSDVNPSAPLPSWPIVWQISSSCLPVALLRFPTSAMWNTGKDPDLSSRPAFVLVLSGMLMIVQIFAQNFLFRYCWKSRQCAVPDRTDQTMVSFFSFFLTYSSTKTEVTLDPQVPPSNFYPSQRPIAPLLYVAAWKCCKLVTEIYLFSPF